MTRIRAVLFDFDGTLYAMKGVYKIIFASLCFPRISYLPKYMRIRQYFRGRDFGDSQAMHEAFCREFEKRYGITDADYWIKNSFSTSFIKTLYLMRNRKEYTHILRQLKKRGIQRVLFSDFGLIESRLRALGIAPDNFDYILSAEDIGALKPAARTFQTVADQLKGIAPEEILVVGDRDDTDGAAACAAGMPFLKVNGHSNRGWDQAVQILHNL
ncbi:MAG: HAD family hydrolase [Fibrobacterota bacterium]